MKFPAPLTIHAVLGSRYFSSDAAHYLSLLLFVSLSGCAFRPLYEHYTRVRHYHLNRAHPNSAEVFVHVAGTHWDAAVGLF